MFLEAAFGLARWVGEHYAWDRAKKFVREHGVEALLYPSGSIIILKLELPPMTISHAQKAGELTAKRTSRPTRKYKMNTNIAKRQHQRRSKRKAN